MARITDRLLVQRVDDLLVIMDESAGAEIVVQPEDRQRFLAAVDYLFREAGWPASEVIAPEHAARIRDADWPDEVITPEQADELAGMWEQADSEGGPK